MLAEDPGTVSFGLPNVGSAVRAQPTERDMSQYAVLEDELEALFSAGRLFTGFSSLASFFASLGMSCWVAEMTTDVSAVRAGQLVILRVGGLVLAGLFGVLAMNQADARNAKIGRIKETSRPVTVGSVVIHTS